MKAHTPKGTPIPTPQPIPRPGVAPPKKVMATSTGLLRFFGPAAQYAKGDPQ